LLKVNGSPFDRSLFSSAINKIKITSVCDVNPNEISTNVVCCFLCFDVFAGFVNENS
jgi:hypothetical protein